MNKYSKLYLVGKVRPDSQAAEAGPTEQEKLLKEAAIRRDFAEVKATAEKMVQHNLHSILYQSFLCVQS